YGRNTGRDGVVCRNVASTLGSRNRKGTSRCGCGSLRRHRPLQGPRRGHRRPAADTCYGRNTGRDGVVCRNVASTLGSRNRKGTSRCGCGSLRRHRPLQGPRRGHRRPAADTC
ncbi:jg27380, partial [Pararge aegeria aegeria]